MTMKSSIYGEIRSDFIDETYINKNILHRHIDAWFTDDDDEEGRTIAIVTAKKAEPENEVTVKYQDEKAKTDNEAQAMIHLAVQDMKKIEFER